MTNITLVDSDLGAITITFPVTGDTDNDHELDPGEEWVIEVGGNATTGQYENTGTACGTAINSQSYCDDDLSHYLGFSPGIAFEKWTNDIDADDAPGPYIAIGDTVIWTYKIYNPGDSALSNVTLVDSDLGPITITFPVTGDINGNQKLDHDEEWIIKVGGNATDGQYENIGTACGVGINDSTYCDVDTSHYFGFTPEIHIEKLTNDEDADDSPGPFIAVGDTVVWTYKITNPGDSAMTNLTLVDSDLGAITITYPVTGDTDNDHELDPGEEWIIKAGGNATVGPYENIGITCANAINLLTYCDDDTSHYHGIVPGIHLEKLTNGENADNAPGPSINVGEPVTWTYQITNTGDSALANITLDDSDLGNIIITFPVTGDTDNDLLLDNGETWIIEVSGIATLGQYENTGTACGVALNDSSYCDEDKSHYFGEVNDDYGDAPEGSIAYIYSGVIGTFPTCSDESLAGFISHGITETLFFGPSVDGELDGNHNHCDPYGNVYDNDECFNDGDAGLIKPKAFTINTSGEYDACSGNGTTLAKVSDTIRWGVNLDIMIHNNSDATKYFNVLFDWNHDGSWAAPMITGLNAIPSTPEHVLVNFEIPAGHNGPVSDLISPDQYWFIASGSWGYIWTRFSLTDVPVISNGVDGPANWDGSGQFSEGETEDYLLFITAPPVIPLSNWTLIIAFVLILGFTIIIIRRRGF